VNTLNELIGHGGRQPCPARGHMYVRGNARQKHCGLSRGISPTYHNHFLTRAQLPFHGRSGVVNALPFIAVVVGHIQFAIASTRRDHDGARR
jgi:hypothetical protein